MHPTKIPLLISDAELLLRVETHRQANLDASATELLSHAADEVLEAAFPGKAKMIAGGRTPQQYFGGSAGRNFVHRVFIADMICNLQDVSGFRERLESIDSEEKFVSTIPELEAAQLFIRAGLKLRFSSDQAEPDLIIETENEEVAVEVKRRSKNDLHEDGRLKKIASEARRQMRNWDQRIVVARQSLSASSDDDVKRGIVQEVEALMARDHRLSGFIFIDEQSLESNTMHGMFGEVLTRHSADSGAEVQRIFDKLQSTSIVSPYWRPLFFRALPRKEAQEYLAILLANRADIGARQRKWPNGLPARFIERFGQALGRRFLYTRTRAAWTLRIRPEAGGLQHYMGETISYPAGTITILEEDGFIRLKIDASGSHRLDSFIGLKKYLFFIKEDYSGRISLDPKPTGHTEVLGIPIMTLIRDVLLFLASKSFAFGCSISHFEITNLSLIGYDAERGYRSGGLLVWFPEVIFEIDLGKSGVM